MHKPLLADGQAAEFLERFHLPVSNTAVIKLTLATQSLASIAYVDAGIAAHNTDDDAHQGKPVAFAWKLAGGDLIMSKATGTDTLDVSIDYQGVTALPAKTTFALSANRELVLQLPA